MGTIVNRKTYLRLKFACKFLANKIMKSSRRARVQGWVEVSSILIRTEFISVAKLREIWLIAKFGRDYTIPLFYTYRMAAATKLAQLRTYINSLFPLCAFPGKNVSYIII